MAAVQSAAGQLGGGGAGAGDGATAAGGGGGAAGGGAPGTWAVKPQFGQEAVPPGAAETRVEQRGQRSVATAAHRDGGV